MTSNGSMGVVYSIKERSINRSMRDYKKISKGVDRHLEFVVWRSFNECFSRTKETTMMATGELQSVLSVRKRKVGSGIIFSLGYGATKNNQAVAQEFESGPVHHRESDHFRKKSIGFGREDEERAKCSRVPFDLWAFSGHKYKHNSGARRKALARSIGEIFGDTPRSARKTGEDFFYVPSFNRYIRRLNKSTADHLKRKAAIA